MESNDRACAEDVSDGRLGSEPAEPPSAPTALVGSEAARLEVKEVGPNQQRWHRKHQIRARTIGLKHMTRHELEIGRALYPEVEPDRPRTRDDCVNGPRPCPYVACRHHLYLDVTRGGGIKLNFPDLEVWEMTETCALDVADRGGATLDQVGNIMNLTRERVRQVEVETFAKLVQRKDALGLRGEVEAGSTGKRRLPMLPEHHGSPAEHRSPADVQVA